jgi:ribose-phosphate pyrophosphokinase
MESSRGKLLIAACRSGKQLAEKVVQSYQDLLKEAGSGSEVTFLLDVDKSFSDSETGVTLEKHVSGCDVFLIQALLDPTSKRSVDQNYMALWLAARAFRENGANHVTAVLPYLAYARQDKPTKFLREPIAARLAAELTVQSGIDRVIVWDPHCGQIRGFYGSVPVHMLDSLSLFIDRFSEFKGRQDVIVVAPDQGAAKFVSHIAAELDLSYAIGIKFRPKPEVADIADIVGDFDGKNVALIFDDMISGAGTVYELSKKLVKRKRALQIYMGVSHNLCLPVAKERLTELHERGNLKKIAVTNSIPQARSFRKLPFLEELSLSEILARTINRIHFNQSVSEVFFRPGPEV